MLTHACTSYVGFEEIAAELKRAALSERVSRVLGKLGPVKDKWQVVWGPTGYRALLMPFDSAAMYVAQSREHASRLVIAVRGTNPVSLYDWVFGDLTVTQQVPWPYHQGAADAGAKVSFSTAFGLSILQHLRWEPAEGAATTQLWRALGAKVSEPFLGAAHALRKRLVPAAGEAMRTLRGRVRTSLGDVGDSFVDAAPETLDKQLEALHERHIAWTSSSFGTWLEEALERLEGTRFDPLRFVVGGAALRQGFASGRSLQEFLAAFVSDADGPVEIVVTGHSKGGALATTLALWLADTQGAEGIADADRWDPTRKATVHAFSYAGPTAGNAAFARHSDHVIGARCHRVVNRLDVVPRAWDVETLSDVPALFEAPVHRPAVVERLIGDLIEGVRALEYRQIGHHVTELPGVLDVDKRWFVQQTVHQHLDGYLAQMGLSPEMSAATFFDPLKSRAAGMEDDS